MKIAQILLIVLQVVGLFIGLHKDVNGQEAKPPKGFSGIVTTILSTAIVVALYYFAGLYNELF